MKKLIAITLTFFVLLSSAATAAFAKIADEISVYVTIANENGKLVLSQEKISVTDIDSDNVLTINDALYNAHQSKYKGGAKAGYESAKTEYGVSLNKLWGVTNGGSYSYYLNNKSALSLSDTVKDGDYINAFIFTDLNSYSDTYCYFNINSASVDANEKINLTLTSATFDDNFNPITVPVENAFITVNGEKTAVTTNAKGEAVIQLKDSGDYVISATSDTQILVPPVCKLTVKNINTKPVTQPVTSKPQSNIETDNDYYPNTGSDFKYFITLTFISIGALTIFIIKSRNSYEK
ncbi:MAG: hypothetical protein U0L20_03110 [Ruminococcus sp.]|nr:hypothetical protein [Ruminococcus sp.]